MALQVRRNSEGMIHHFGVFASDFAASRSFYLSTLKPLASQLGYESEGVAEFWQAEFGTPSLSLETATGAPTVGMHVAFTADRRQQVDEFFAEAVEAGGVSLHAPRHWPEYRDYCAFVSDRDGNNIEAVHKENA